MPPAKKNCRKQNNGHIQHFEVAHPRYSRGIRGYQMKGAKEIQSPPEPGIRDLRQALAASPRRETPRKESPKSRRQESPESPGGPWGRDPGIAEPVEGRPREYVSTKSTEGDDAKVARAPRDRRTRNPPREEPRDEDARQVAREELQSNERPESFIGPREPRARERPRVEPKSERGEPKESTKQPENQIDPKGRPMARPSEDENTQRVHPQGLRRVNG
nr:pollen-specific leucine-rich repeat extensin-like protein 1 [Penaeus vannamei]